VKLPIPLQESNPNLNNFNTSYVRTPPCWFCRRDEVKHACTGACTRICPWQCYRGAFETAELVS